MPIVLLLFAIVGSAIIALFYFVRVIFVVVICLLSIVHGIVKLVCVPNET